MAKNKKVIISCAVTGAIHTPSMSEYLPVTADEVIEHSLAAHEAGAAVWFCFILSKRSGST